MGKRSSNGRFPSERPGKPSRLSFFLDEFIPARVRLIDFVNFHYFGCPTFYLYLARSFLPTMIRMDRATKLGAGFICLFALPFAGFGIFAFCMAIRHMLDGAFQPQTWMLLIFGLVFSGVGFGLIFAMLYGSRLAQREQRKQAEHPAEPWLWREDWAQGRVVSKTRSNMIGAWIFAVLWNLVSMPMLFILPQQAAEKPVAYIGLIFPVVGVFLLVRAIRQTWAYREFGKTCFEMAFVPGVIGGELKGVIQARFPSSPERSVHLQLTCVNRVTTGSGDDQSTRENIVWRGESDLSSAQLYPGPAGTAIPVNFRIPWDAQPTEKRGPRDEIVWQLEALAAVPGVDYHDVFEVPVFRTHQTPVHPRPEDTATAVPVAVRPPALTIEITQSAQGTEFYFPAARNKGFAVGITVFTLMFCSSTYLLAHWQAPLIFPVVCGFFALLLLYISVQLWLGTTRVGICNGTLLLQDGFFGGGKVRQFAFSETVSISSAIKSQQGGGTGTPYYDIELNLRSGRKVTLGRTLKNKREVDWLVAEMRRLTGLQPRAEAATTAR